MIVSTREFYEKAFHAEYAIGGFQAYNMEMVQGILEVCAEERSPALVQSSCRGVRYAGAETLYHIARIHSEKLGIPAALHLDHGDSLTLCRQVIDAGFLSVMLDNTGLPFEQQAEKTRMLVQYAHNRGAVVEGEIAMPADCPERWMTLPADAKAFVEYTQCDSLSVCVGNSHALYGRGFPDTDTPHIRMRLLESIHTALPNTPLILHSINALQPPLLKQRFEDAGGKNRQYNVLCGDELHQAMRLGVVKCNIGIDKLAMTVGIREYLRDHPAEMDPRKYLANGKSVMKEAIRQQMRDLFKSCNQLDI